MIEYFSSKYKIIFAASYACANSMSTLKNVPYQDILCEN